MDVAVNDHVRRHAGPGHQCCHSDGGRTAASATADLTFTDAATSATAPLTITVVEQEATGSVNYSTTAAAGLTITAKAGGAAAGAVGAASGGIDVIFVDSNGDVGWR